jgi:hypothetical protein
MVCFGPTKISMDPNDLPLMKALHGENVDEMELFIQNYKKEPKVLNNVNHATERQNGKITGQ